VVKRMVLNVPAATMLLIAESLKCCIPCSVRRKSSRIASEAREISLSSSMRRTTERFHLEDEKTRLKAVGEVILSIRSSEPTEDQKASTSWL
jgi:hypothetical protein